MKALIVILYFFAGNNSPRPDVTSVAPFVYDLKQCRDEMLPKIRAMPESEAPLPMNYVEGMEIARREYYCAPMLASSLSMMIGDYLDEQNKD